MDASRGESLCFKHVVSAIGSLCLTCVYRHDLFGMSRPRAINIVAAEATRSIGHVTALSCRDRQTCLDLLFGLRVGCV